MRLWTYWQWIVRLMLRWVYPGHPAGFSFASDVEILRYARKCVGLMEAIPGVSGEYKRSTVYGKLRKAYPEWPHHELGFAIEVAVREHRCSGS